MTDCNKTKRCWVERCWYHISAAENMKILLFTMLPCHSKTQRSTNIAICLFLQRPEICRRLKLLRRNSVSVTIWAIWMQSFSLLFANSHIHWLLNVPADAVEVRQPLVIYWSVWQWHDEQFQAAWPLFYTTTSRVCWRPARYCHHDELHVGRLRRSCKTA